MSSDHVSDLIDLKPSTKRVMNLSNFLTQQARRQSREIAFVWGDLELSWSVLEARVNAMASALSMQGIKKGDRVLVQSANCNQLFETMFVCFKLGAVWVPTNYRQTPDEVAYLASASGATALICQADFPEHAASILKSTPAIRTVISIGPSDFGSDYDSMVSGAMGEVFRAVDVEHDDPCWFFFTSGTTGRPKASVLTHGQMGFVITNHLCDLMPGMRSSTDASLVVAPLSHGAGIHQLAQVARGVKTILLFGHHFDPAEVWSLVEKWQVTNLFTVPTIVKMLIEGNAQKDFDHTSLKYVIYAGAPMYREDQKTALAALGKVLVQYFGLGEVTGNITVLPPYEHSEKDGEDVKIGTCGFERTAMQVSIQDRSGRELEANETGEICVCGPAVFAGYYNNPKANAEAFRNGWFLTGDIGHMDDEGYLFITGRASDMFISGGSNVYPREVEEKILTHPGIVEVAVLGVPDDKWGEVGIAVCTPLAGVNLEDAEIKQWLRDKVARYKQPKSFIFWGNLPKSGYGKIDKKAIRAELITSGLIETKEVRK